MKFSPIAEEQNKKEAGLNPNAPTFQMQPPPPPPSAGPRRQFGLHHPTYMHPAAAMEAAAAHAAAAKAAQQAAASMQMHMHMAQQSQWMGGTGNGRRFSHGMDMAASGLSIPPNVLRLPRGPDKGKGFQKWCRNRMQETTPAPAPVKKSHAVPIVAPPANVEENKKETPKIEVTPAPEEEPAAVAPAVAPVAIVDVSDDGAGDSGNEDAGSVASEHDAAGPVAGARGLAAAVEAAVAERAAEKSR